MSQIVLPKLFQNNMVLQREKPIRIWGNCPKDSRITVVFGDAHFTFDSEGADFYYELPAMEAGTGYTMEFYVEPYTTVDLVLSNISIGDVWIAGGQSNMEYFLRYDADWNYTKRLPHNSDIHMFNVPRLCYPGQKRNLPDSNYWFEEGDAAWDTFSAPGYYFAREIQESTGVPIAIIGCNWGGTGMRTWMEPELLKQEPYAQCLREYEAEMNDAGLSDAQIFELSRKGWAEEDSYESQFRWRPVMYGLTLEEQKEFMRRNMTEDTVYTPMGPYNYLRPSGLYQNMLKTIVPFSAKGVLWYQGESDSGHPQIFEELFTAMISCWRDSFRDPELPFLFVQLAPFETWLDCTGENYAKIRQAQDAAAHHIPHTAMASIMDIGMYEDIHPKRKKEVGHRLALLARGHVYGEAALLCEAPEFHEASRIGRMITLKFLHAGEGLHIRGTELSALEISTENKPLEIEHTETVLDALVITLKENVDASQKILIRFADEDYCEVNLYNSANLSAKPFIVIV